MIVSNLQEFCQFLKIGQPIISIDYGQKKIGIAISNQEQTIAMPLKILIGLNEKTKLKAISDIIELYSVCAIVLGLPISMDGTASQQTQIVKNFAENLKNMFNLPIYLQDERLTSRAADSLLKSFGMTRKERNSQDDAIAASMLLETTINAIKKL